ncbi:MAG: 16S rRNA (adenine(1518)-N(6)/adenine(1519)-N(6))-dimethyltransferase RsmA [Solirubrobacterales bacterium]
MSRRLGQHFVADPNLLEMIVREAGVGSDDVALEVGGGAGALTERLAPRVRRLHVIELDEHLRPDLEPIASEAGNVELVWGDALRVDLGSLDPAPTKVVSNLPYAIATPMILKTIEELARVGSWTLLVQREIADRLRAAPGSRTYGAPSVLVQLATEVELLRSVDRAVFKPRPRVDSALLALRRRGPAAPEPVRRIVHDAFAHRRKSLARSLDLAAADDRDGRRDAARAALRELGLPEDSRAETLSPQEFVRLAGSLQAN